MAQYIFRDMQGMRYGVDVPDDWSEAQAKEYFDSKLKAQALPTKPVSDAEKAASRAKMALEGTSLPERLMINLGAGMHTAWKGVQGLTPWADSDAEIKAKRESDAALADQTPGGGVAQFAGEVLPTLALPAGSFLRGGQAAWRGGSTALKALAGRLPQGAALAEEAAAAGEASVPVMDAVKAALTKSRSIGGRMGTGAAMGDASLAGAAMGAATPTTSDESRLPGMALGAAGGALLPGVVAGIKKFWSMASGVGAQDRAFAKIVESLGGDEAAKAEASKITGYKPNPWVEDIPLTTAEVTQNPKLARMQMQSEAKNAGDWESFRRNQRTQRSQAFDEITADADKLPELLASRDAATGPLREKALERAGNDPWFHAPVIDTLNQIMESGAKANPNVRKVVNYVRGVLDDGVTPESLYEARKVLADKLKSPRSILDDKLGAAAKGAERETMAVINGIDDALDQASRGAWSRNKSSYMTQYQKASGPVDEARALGRMREDLPQGKIAGTGGNVRDITAANLDKTMERNATNPWGSNLGETATSALNALRDNLEKSDILMKSLKRTGTSGGGSQTGMLTMDNVIDNLLARSRISRTGQAVHLVVGRGKDLEAAAIRDALENPQVFVRGIERKTEMGRPLTRSEEAVLNLLRASTGPAAAELAAQ